MKQDFDVRSGDAGSLELYYSGSDQENRCIGRIRGDLGKSGDEYWASFWEHEDINAAREDCKDATSLRGRDRSKKRQRLAAGKLLIAIRPWAACLSFFIVFGDCGGIS